MAVTSWQQTCQGDLLLCAMVLPDDNVLHYQGTEALEKTN